MLRRARPCSATFDRILRQSGPDTLQRRLRALMLDPSANPMDRASAASVLASAEAKQTTADLINLFFARSNQQDLWQTALVLESFGNHAAIPRLIQALSDSNHHRRRAAARALGWIPHSGKRAAAALVQVLIDKEQPNFVRAEAAESLSQINYPRAIPALISVMHEPDSSIRFWSVFALGSISQFNKPPDTRAIAALELRLSDEGTPEGNWWSVGKEALAMLGHLTPLHEVKLAEEIDSVLSNEQASPEDRRWADFYGPITTKS